MTPEQCRAARGWIGWSQTDLAGAAHVGIATVKDFERGSRNPIANNRAAMKAALEAKGIGFSFDDDGKPTGITFLPLSATKPQPENVPAAI
jgi:hypothetical protein